MPLLKTDNQKLQDISEGSRQKALETARLMLQRDYPSTEICMITGLSQEEVAAIN